MDHQLLLINLPIQPVTKENLIATTMTTTTTTMMKVSRAGRMAIERNLLVCVTKIPIAWVTPIVTCWKCSKHWKNCDTLNWNTCLGCQELSWTIIDTSIQWKALLSTWLNYLWLTLHRLSVIYWLPIVKHPESMTPSKPCPANLWMTQLDGQIRCSLHWRTIIIIPRWCAKRLIATNHWCLKRIIGVRNRVWWRERPSLKLHEKCSLLVWSINWPRIPDRRPTEQPDPFALSLT